MKSDQSGLNSTENTSDIEPLSPAISAAQAVPWTLRVGAAWSWRFLVIIGAIGLLVYLLGFISGIVLAFLLAFLLALLLSPLVSFLKKRLGMGRTGAAAIGLLTGLLIVMGLLSVALTQLIMQSPQLFKQSIEGFNALVDWAVDGPWAIDGDELRGWIDNVQNDILAVITKNSSTIASGALSVATSAASMVTSGLLMVFILFFLLRDGRQMWIVALRSMPAAWREQANEAGIRGWVTMRSYVGTQVKVAGIDAVGIGLGAFFLGVPMAIPITVLVFLSSFVPIVGAFFSGAVAVLIALVNNGITAAIVMLVIVLAVQQIESNVLQPFMMSHAVSLHPVAVVIAVTGGGMVAGIAGAVFAVPLLAFLNVTVKYLHGHDAYPWLNTDLDRPGGPPGSLQQQIDDSYRSGDVAASKKEPKEGSVRDRIANRNKKNPKTES